jgi:hypothetical protein
LFNPGKRSVLIPVGDNPLGQGRADAGQLIELLQGDFIEIEWHVSDVRGVGLLGRAGWTAAQTCKHPQEQQ